MRAHARDTQRARTRAPVHPGPRAVEQRRLSRARLAGAAQERRRVARDLHDGVQNELVSLILGLSLAEDDRNTPPELRASLSVLRARAQSTLSGIREIAHGIRPPLLAAAGVIEALRAQAALARIPVNLVGTVPRSSDNAEEAVYFACLEALQNVAKHAPRSASVTLRLRYREGRLAVRIADDGGGFVQIRGREGAGLTNIRDRVASVGGKARISSTPGQGTVVAVAVPWPAKPAAPPGSSATSVLMTSGRSA
jgi:signal transduction histidine kinase